MYFCWSCSLAFLTALFIFHIIFAFHASLGKNSLRFLQKYGSLSLNKASTERRQCLYNTAHAATWKGTLIYFTSSTQGSLNVFHILHGYGQTFDLHRSLPVAQFPLLCVLTGFVPRPEDMPGALRGRLFHHGHCHSLESQVVAKRHMQWPAIKCFFSQVWNLAAHCHNSICWRQHVDDMERQRH